MGKWNMGKKDAYLEEEPKDKDKKSDNGQWTVEKYEHFRWWKSNI